MATRLRYRTGHALSGRGPMNRIRHLASVLVVSLATQAPAQTTIDAALGAEPLGEGIRWTDRAIENDGIARAKFETAGGVLVDP